MSDRRFFRNTNGTFNNTQPVQQQYYSNPSMPYNGYYDAQQLSNQLPNSAVYSRPMAGYGNGTMNGSAAAAGFAHRLNPDAPAFTPGVRYMTNQETQSAPMSNYSAHYSSYMTGAQPIQNQQSAMQAQQHVALVQQQQMRGYPHMQTYESPTRSQYSAMHRMFANSNSQYGQIGQQPQVQTYADAASKYQQSVPASQSPHSYMSQEPQLSLFAQNDGIQSSTNDLSPAQFNQFPISAELSQTIQNNQNRMAIVEIQIGLEQLVTEPHEYELWANAIKGRISSGLTKDDYELVAWLIVEMSYMGTDAQYSVARLCKLLDSDVKSFTSQYVIPRIAQFMDNGVANLERDHLCNFVVFLAELYDKTENNGIRVSRLGTYMINLIRILLDCEDLTDQIVKSIVQVLKLTGRHVEDDQDPVYLNQIFGRLNELMENSISISDSVKHNIRQLNQLREKQWGVTKNDDLLNGTMHGSSYNGAQADVVMYGPDGQPLSEEERKFLEDNCRDMETAFGGMDDEMAQDYEAFLREQAEATAISTAEKALEKLTVDEEELNTPAPKSS
ncbi:hypothetical protein M3Y98_00938700 [Aphelenchoides besseyi]|nr:hypothetical protein M3Y98_00938700 [Aphelenchoides besseyi]